MISNPYLYFGYCHKICNERDDLNKPIQDELLFVNFCTSRCTS